ncbi:FecR domain-containing protein [Parapedobacter composti]
MYLWKKPRSIVTKAGERKKVTLADGSEITMNSASRIRYPERFDNSANL